MVPGRRLGCCASRVGEAGFELHVVRSLWKCPRAGSLVPAERLPWTKRGYRLPAVLQASWLGWWWQASDEAGSYMLVEVRSQSKLVSISEKNDNVVWGNIIPNSSS